MGGLFGEGFWKGEADAAGLLAEEDGLARSEDDAALIGSSRSRGKAPASAAEAAGFVEVAVQHASALDVDGVRRSRARGACDMSVQAAGGQRGGDGEGIVDDVKTSDNGGALTTDGGEARGAQVESGACVAALNEDGVAGLDHRATLFGTRRSGGEPPAGATKTASLVEVSDDRTRVVEIDKVGAGRASGSVPASGRRSTKECGEGFQFIDDELITDVRGQRGVRDDRAGCVAGEAGGLAIGGRAAADRGVGTRATLVVTAGDLDGVRSGQCSEGSGDSQGGARDARDRAGGDDVHQGNGDEGGLVDGEGDIKNRSRAADG